MNNNDFDNIRMDVQRWPDKKIIAVNEQLLNSKPLFDIEAASACNLNCVFCPRSKMSRSAKIMNPKTFDLILSWLPENAVIMFSGLGECLLNPHLEDYIALLKNCSISSCIITNGILLTPERQNSLINSGIAQIQVSYLTTEEDKYYSQITKGGDFNRLHENLQYLSKIKPASLRVQLNFVDMNDGGNDQRKVEEAAEKWGFDFYYRRLHSRGGKIELSAIPGEEKQCYSGCGIFSSTTFITAEGDLLSCSNNVDSQSKLGNVTSYSFEDLKKKKLGIIKKNKYFQFCSTCNDDYRWYIQKNLSYD